MAPPANVAGPFSFSRKSGLGIDVQREAMLRGSAKPALARSRFPAQFSLDKDAPACVNSFGGQYTMSEMTADQALDFIQTRLGHEDNLINQRVSWLASSQSFFADGLCHYCERTSRG